MAWITPSGRSTGEVITAPIWNQDVVANPTQNHNDILLLNADAAMLYTRQVPIVLNSHFQVWQRGTSFTHTGGVAYWADRWAGRRGANAAGMTISRQSIKSDAADYVLRMQRDNGNSATDILFVMQSLPEEAVIPLQGKTMTLLIRARRGANFSGGSNFATTEVRYSTAANLAPDTSAGTNVATGGMTLTTSFALYTLNFTVPTDAKSLTIQTRYTPVGTAGAADYIEFNYMDIVPSATNTSSRLPLPYELELLRCMRFYQRINPEPGESNLTVGYGYSLTATSAEIVIPYRVPMRIAPTLEWSSSSGLNYNRGKDGSTLSSTPTNLAKQVTGSSLENGMYISITGMASDSACIGFPGRLGLAPSTSYIAFNAEI